MKYYVYFIQSIFSPNWIYIGSTNSLQRRVKQHNSKKVISTKHYAPLKLIYREKFEIEKLARDREKFLKTIEGCIEKKMILTKIINESNGSPKGV